MGLLLLFHSNNPMSSADFYYCYILVDGVTQCCCWFYCTNHNTESHQLLYKSDKNLHVPWGPPLLPCMHGAQPPTGQVRQPPPPPPSSKGPALCESRSFRHSDLSALFVRHSASFPSLFPLSSFCSSKLHCSSYKSKLSSLNDIAGSDLDHKYSASRLQCPRIKGLAKIWQDRMNILK